MPFLFTLSSCTISKIPQSQQANNPATLPKIFEWYVFPISTSEHQQKQTISNTNYLKESATFQKPLPSSNLERRIQFLISTQF